MESILLALAIFSGTAFCFGVLGSFGLVLTGVITIPGTAAYQIRRAETKAQLVEIARIREQNQMNLDLMINARIDAATKALALPSGEEHL